MGLSMCMVITVFISVPVVKDQMVLEKAYYMAKEYQNSFKNGDLDKILELIYIFEPDLDKPVEIGIGHVEIGIGIESKYRESHITITRPAKSNLYKTNKCWFIIFPGKSRAIADFEEFINKVYLIGVSENQGKSWQFFEGDEEEIRIWVVGFPEKAKFPKLEK